MFSTFKTFVNFENKKKLKYEDVKKSNFYFVLYISLKIQMLQFCTFYGFIFSYIYIIY